MSAIPTNILLADSDMNIWALGVNADGLLTTTPATGTPETLILNASETSWQIGVGLDGRITTTQIAFSLNPNSIILLAPSNFGWVVMVTTEGLLETMFGNFSIWQQNGFGAGTDNRVVGGLGGFMAYPQPPNPIGVGPEANGQFGPLNFIYDSSTATAKGNMFEIVNPGRN